MTALLPLTCVISGGAKGADAIAFKVAVELGVPTEVYMADWTEHGRAAGPIRNRQMLVEGKPDIVIAFSYDLTQSKGTANMVTQAKKAGVKVVVIDHEDQGFERPQERLI